jgi:propanol-preferring alcohol dehydrogenase
MKAAQVVALREPLEITEVSDPEPGPSDIIIKTEAEGICRSDWHLWQADLSWGIDVPRILGHEFAGTVVEAGRDVQTFKAGDRAMPTFHIGCAHCRYCRAGYTNICENFNALGNTIDGGYAEYVRVPRADFNCVHLPDAIDAVTAAAIGCRYMTAFSGVERRGRLQAGEWMVVHGVGGVGLSAVQIGNCLGARVIAVDIDDDKLKYATDQGATVAINSRRENVPQTVRALTGSGADLSIDALGSTETANNSLRSLRKAGRHVQLGVISQTGNEVPLPLNDLVITELEILGSHGNPITQLPRLLALVEMGTLKPKELVSQEVALEEANGVLEAMGSFKTTGFNVITAF